MASRRERREQQLRERAEGRARRQQEREERRRRRAELNSARPTECKQRFVNVNGEPLPLVNFYLGASCFVILSGPSISTLDLSLLTHRGIITLGVNNSPAIFRPNLWLYTDRPNKFHQSIWLDPGIVKFVVHEPRQHFSKWPLRQKNQGQFTELQNSRSHTLYPKDMPGVIGYSRNSNFQPDQWLNESSANRGNSKESSERNGQPRCLNTMFTAIKIAYALGFRVVYLLGCDFYMNESQPYAFGEHGEKDDRARAGIATSNNHGYYQMNLMFLSLRPHFDAAGFHVFNCNPYSHLTAFDHVSYQEAIESATAHIPQDPLDTEGWYNL